MINALLVSTHIDDETLSSFGVINQYNCKILEICSGRDEENGKIRKSIASDVYSNIEFADISPDLKLQYTDIPKIVDAIIRASLEFKPKVLFIPSSQDLHQDHSLVNRAGKIAFNKCTNFSEVYEIIGESRDPVTNFDTIVKLTNAKLKLKQEICDRYSEIEKFSVISKYEYLKTYFRLL